jgi:hypothetical protein
LCVALLCGAATTVVVYRETTLTVAIGGLTVGSVLVLGGIVVGAKTERWGELPGLSGLGAVALSVSITVVGTFQPAQSNCADGDCAQGGGLGLLAMFVGAYIVFLATMSLGRLLARHGRIGFGNTTSRQ